MIGVKDEFGFNQIFRHSLGNRQRAQYRIDKIIEVLPEGPLNILEIGCGFGELTKSLLIKNHYVTAIDQSELMVEATRAQCGECKNLELIRVEAESFLHTTEKTFDVVVGMGILHHLTPRLENVLKMIKNILSPAGQGFFWEPNAQNPLAHFIFESEWGRKWLSLDPEEKAFSKNHIENRLQSAGFTFDVSEADWVYPFTPLSLHPVLRSWEAKASPRLRKHLAQSLWIQFKKASEPKSS